MTTRTLDRRNGSAQIIPIAAIAAAPRSWRSSLRRRGGGRATAMATAVSLRRPRRQPVASRRRADAAPDRDPAAPSHQLSRPTISSDGMPIMVDLDTVSGADVYSTSSIRTGYLVSAESGKPDEGRSVRRYTLQIETSTRRRSS